MSRNGASLSDWQWIYNAVNERRKATMFANGHENALALIPVPQDGDHLKSSQVDWRGLISDIPLGFCDQTTPLEIITWNNSPDDSGTRPDDVNPLITYMNGNPIVKGVPEYGSHPGVNFGSQGGVGTAKGGYIAGSGWFLDWIESALSYMTKYGKEISGTHVSPYLTNYRSSLQWNTSTGEIYDFISGEYITGVVIQNYADFYDYAKTHLHENTQYQFIDALVSVENDGNNIFIDLNHASIVLSNPGVVPANVTLYYSSFGDDLGYTVNSSSTVTSYSTQTFQNVTDSNPVTVGFDSSTIGIAPALPAAGGIYKKTEELKFVFAVWDFENYYSFM